MKALSIIALLLTATFLVTVKWGIIAVIILVLMYFMIQSDKDGAAIEGFFAGCFFLAILGGIYELGAMIFQA